jgi:hypothetical protein
MHIASLEQFAQDVAHLLGNAEEADRAAFGGFGAAQVNYSRSLRAKQSSWIAASLRSSR